MMTSSTEREMPRHCEEPEGRRGNPGNRARSWAGLLRFTRKDDYRWLTISLIAHALLLATFTLAISSVKQPITLGNAERQVVSSYLADAQSFTAPTTNQQPIIQPLKNAIALTQQKQSTPQSAMPHQRAAIKGEPMPALIALLHAAIQRQQHYPASAQEMEREGRVTLSFRLLSNGAINNPKIVHSSGTASLDSAALAAVNDAAPFQHIDQYIKSAEDYQIDVVFELS